MSTPTGAKRTPSPRITRSTVENRTPTAVKAVELGSTERNKILHLANPKKPEGVARIKSTLKYCIGMQCTTGINLSKDINRMKKLLLDAKTKLANIALNSIYDIEDRESLTKKITQKAMRNKAIENSGRNISQDILSKAKNVFKINGLTYVEESTIKEYLKATKSDIDKLRSTPALYEDGATRLVCPEAMLEAVGIVS